MRAPDAGRKISKMSEPLFPDLTRLLPDEYAAYRPLVERGAVKFLSLLPAARQQEIVLALLASPGGTRSARRVLTLLRLCPTLHKLGQLLARDRRLAPALRRQLQRLEAMPPVTTTAELKPAIHAALGRHLPFRLGRRALAEGSAAIALPFVYDDPGSPGGLGDGVLKLPRPGIGERIEAEIAAWEALCPWLAETGAALGLPDLPYAETFATLAGQLRAELDAGREQQHLAAVAGLYADGAARVPSLLPWCAAGFTAMTRLRGVKLSDGAGADARGLAAILVEALLARPFWCAEPSVLVHADPHAGNLLRLDAEGIGIVDWAMAARVSKAEREAITDIALGGLTLDACVVDGALARLFGGRPIPPDLVVSALAEVARGTFPGIAWVLALLDRCAIVLRTSLSAELLLVRKALANVLTVVADLAPGYRPDDAFLAGGIAQAWREWPLRMAAAPTSRAWATHVSLLDVWSLSLAAPDLGRRAWHYRRQAVATNPALG